MTCKDDIYWMQQALFLAEQAATANEIPVGAIVVNRDQIVGQGFNQPVATNDPTAHAEIIAIRDAAKKLQNYRLADTTFLYVTLEPCLMCVGAMLHSRISRVIYAVTEPKFGALGSILDITNYNWNHKLSYTKNVLVEPCTEILRNFFQVRR